MTTCMDFLQLMKIFDDFLQLLTLCNDSHWLVTTWNDLWQLMRPFDNFWQLVITCDKLWQLVTTRDNCDNLWQYVKLERFTRYWTNCKFWKSVTDRRQTDRRQKTEWVTMPVLERHAPLKMKVSFRLSLSFCDTYKDAMESDYRLVDEDSLEKNFRHLF